MAISPVGNTSASATQASALSSATAAEQQDRFMTLLVAQMKNQDPLNPMDNAQMTSQIAQINTVGGIEKLNRTVESLLGAFSSLQAQSATQLPGRFVLISGTSLELEADAASGQTGPAVGGVELQAAADTVAVDVLDAGGNVVRTLSLGQSAAGVRSFSWDGLKTDGSAADAGAYRLRVSATSGGKSVEAAPLVAARVAAVSTTGDGVKVDLGSNGIRAYSDLKSFL